MGGLLSPDTRGFYRLCRNKTGVWRIENWQGGWLYGYRRRYQAWLQGPVAA